MADGAAEVPAGEFIDEVLPHLPYDPSTPVVEPSDGVMNGDGPGSAAWRRQDARLARDLSTFHTAELPGLLDEAVEAGRLSPRGELRILGNLAARSEDEVEDGLARDWRRRHHHTNPKTTYIDPEEAKAG